MIVNNVSPFEAPTLLPPARAEVGVTGDLSANPGMIMGRFILPPGVRSHRQYEINADLALFVVEGSGNLECGPAFSAEVDPFSAKDFIYIEHGEIFSLENTGSETCTFVFVLVGVDKLDELQQVMVEVEAA